MSWVNAHGGLPGGWLMVDRRGGYFMLVGHFLRDVLGAGGHFSIGFVLDYLHDVTSFLPTLSNQGG